MKKHLLFAVAALLALSLVGNAVLYRYAIGFHGQLNEVRLDPLGLKRYGSVPLPPSSSTSKRVVLVGDSRIEMWPLPRSGSAQGFDFLNRGISYQTTAQVLGRFDQDVARAAPQFIVIEVGVNDLKTIPLFPSRRAEIVATVKTNLTQLVARSTALGAVVLLFPVFPVGPIPLHRAPFWSDAVAQSIREVNAFLPTLQAHNVRLLTIQPLLDGPGGELKREFAHDMLHLNSRAYAELETSVLLPALRQSP